MFRSPTIKGWSFSSAGTFQNPFRSTQLGSFLLPHLCGRVMIPLSLVSLFLDFKIGSLYRTLFGFDKRSELLFAGAIERYLAMAALCSLSRVDFSTAFLSAADLQRLRDPRFRKLNSGSVMNQKEWSSLSESVFHTLKATWRRGY